MNDVPEDTVMASLYPLPGKPVPGTKVLCLKELSMYGVPNGPPLTIPIHSVGSVIDVYTTYGIETPLVYGICIGWNVLGVLETYVTSEQDDILSFIKVLPSV